jgi:hypothetical protein
VRAGLALAVTTIAAAAAPATNAGFTLQPCQGSATAGRGATFPAPLHNVGYWAAGFDSSSGCGGVPDAPSHPTYKSPTIDATGQAAGASATGSGGGVGACGGGAGGWPVGHRDSTVRFCATDDPVTTTQLGAIDNGPAGAIQQGMIHQLPWAAGAVTVVIHLRGVHASGPGNERNAGFV